MSGLTGRLRRLEAEAFGDGGGPCANCVLEWLYLDADEPEPPRVLCLKRRGGCGSAPRLIFRWPPPEGWPAGSPFMTPLP